MNRYSEIWRIVATFDTAQPILINFRLVRLKRLRMPYDDNEWHILRNKASSGPVWPVVGNGGQLWSRISSLQELVHFKAELRELGLVYQVIACTALLDKIGQIWSKVAYNGPVFVIVSWYGRCEQYLSLYYLFCEVLWYSVMFDHISIKETRKRESGQKWSIIIQYEPLLRDMTNYGHIRHRISNTDQFPTSAPEKATYDLW